jgi:hypothetical protein
MQLQAILLVRSRTDWWAVEEARWRAINGRKRPSAEPSRRWSKTVSNEPGLKTGSYD